jgi:hypothetical protein
MPETDPISTDNTTLGGILQQQMPGMLAGNKTLQEKAVALPNTLKKIEAEGTAKEQPYLDKLDKLTADQMRIYQGKPPQTEPTSLIEEWGSPAMLFAIFGSMFTRMPMTSALNAAAAVNKAYQQRDFDAADRAYKQWKESNDLAIKLYEIQSNSLEKAIEKIRSGTKEEKADARADLSARSSVYGWGHMKDLIAAGKDEEAVNLWDTTHTAAANMKGFNTTAEWLHDLEKRSRDVGQEVVAAQKSGDKDALAAAQKKAADLKQEWHEYQESGAKKTTGEKPEASHNIEITDAAGKPVFSGAAHKDSNGKWIRDDNLEPVPEGNIRIGSNTVVQGAEITDEDANRIAGEYLAGDKQALTGLGYGNMGAKNRAKAQSAITKLMAEEGRDPKDIVAAQAELAGLTAGERTTGQRAATLGMALAEAEIFVPLAVQTSEKIDRTQYPNINAIQEAIMRGTGNEDMAQFIVYNRSVTSVYSQVLRRGGMPSDQSDREASALLDMAYSQGQYKAAADAIMTEAKGAKKAPDAVRAELRAAITGKPTATTPAAGAPPASTPTITTQQQYDALPPDSDYLGSDGHLRHKPKATTPGYQ